MTTTNAYTLDDILALRPCDPDQRRALFADARTLTAREALERGATVRDLLWVAGRLGRKADCVRFAIACARCHQSRASVTPRRAACSTDTGDHAQRQLKSHGGRNFRQVGSSAR